METRLSWIDLRGVSTAFLRTILVDRRDDPLGVEFEAKGKDVVSNEDNEDEGAGGRMRGLGGLQSSWRAFSMFPFVTEGADF